MAKKMESDDRRVLGPMLFLLLVMPPPLSAGSSWPRVLSWRRLNRHLGQEREGFNRRARYHRSEQDKFRYCKGKFDLYFVVDRSNNMKNRWEEIYSIVEKMVKKYTNPKLRMSFISSDGETLMAPTSDRNAIKKGLEELRNVEPLGELDMGPGFKKVNELIQPVHKKDNQAASLVISMIGGLMVEEAVFETRREAYKARNMGAKVYSVGLEDYSRRQLTHIVEGEHQIYEKGNYNTIDSLVNSLVDNSCLDVMGEDTYFVCVGESYILAFFSSVLKEQNINDYVCRYNVDNTTLYTLKAINITKVKLLCQGHTFEKDRQMVVVDYSLNNGVKFQDQTLKMTSRKCSSPPPPPPIKPTVTRPYLVLLIPAMLMFPLLFCCIWPLCFKKTVKEPPPVQKPGKEPETRPIQTCPTVIVPCCGCQEDSMQRMEEKLDILCDFVQNYNQVPLMYCQLWDKGRCIDVTLVNPHCIQMPYGSMACLGPSQDYFPLNSCCSWCQHHPQICSQLPSRMYPLTSCCSWCQHHPQIRSQLPSRMLPLIPPTARALCRTTLSLPPHRQPLKH
ncbi:anthrax toxin receptor-like [Myotis daubentonii]|uniref:anthrax toxin receptor-like n=1 Tax=Myotis daubentonii TaxID=98922 RepID=UPI002872B6F1|nr:anthrax toxin receptor-like [Myotis daubentonii]